MSKSATASTFTENDIRPDHLMKAQAEIVEADLQMLLAHKANFIEVGCPACNSTDSEFAFDKKGINYVVCRECETMYVNPRPTPEILETYYSTSENYAYWNKHIFPASEAVRREKIFRPRATRTAEFCERYGVPEKTLLEVGSGFGTFCEEVKQLGIFDRIYAVEPTPDLAETCRQRGLDVIEKPFEKVDEIERVGVIASFEAVEHMFSPEAFVKQCARILPTGGLLIISCPSGKGFDVTVMQAASDTVDHEHLNYLHPRSLAHLVSRCGFEVLEVQTPGKLDAELVRKRTLAGNFDLQDAFLRQVLIDDWERVGGAFQQFLADNLLSSHMWLVARKL